MILTKIWAEFISSFVFCIPGVLDCLLSILDLEVAAFTRKRGAIVIKLKRARLGILARGAVSELLFEAIDL